MEIRQFSSFHSENNSSVSHVYYEKIGTLKMLRVIPQGIIPIWNHTSTLNQSTFLLWYKDHEIEYLGGPSEYYPDFWSVGLRLKPQADESYLATKDPKMKVLSAKYGVTLEWSDQLYYYLRGNGSNKEDAVNDFLATGKFYEY